MGARVELHVLTREGNREAIRSHVAASVADDPIRGVTFHYHDLASPFLWLKRRGILPTFAYYILWQRAVRHRFNTLAEEMQVVHHLTFCNLLCPGFWRLKKAAFVIGPVGAPLVADSYLPLFGEGARVQRWRGALMRNFHRLPWLRPVLAGAAVIIPANSDAKGLLEARGFRTRPVMLDTGPSDTPFLKKSAGTAGAGTRFVFAGRLERRKGLELSLRALALAAPEMDEWDFLVIGDGPDTGRLKQMAVDLGISGRVHFRGKIPHLETLVEMAGSDVFLFTSVRDTSGGVNLEAMSLGLPVICLAHQGVGDITDETCAERIEPTGIRETVERLSRAIVRMAVDRARREAMGKAAELRASTCFSWEEKFAAMERYFREAAGKAPRSDPP